MTIDTPEQETFTLDDLRRLQILIPKRIARLTEQGASASTNLDDAEHVASWFALLQQINGKLKAFEAQR